MKNVSQLRTSCLLILLISFEAMAGPVLVTAGNQRGQGLARMNGAECMIIAPRHVVAAARNPDVQIDIFGPENSHGLARIAQLVVGTSEDDISLLRVVSNDEALCSEIDAPEIRQAGTSIAIRAKSGVLTYRHVHIVSTGDISIGVRPATEFDILVPGMSGGVLLIDGKASGLLLHVPTAQEQLKSAEVRSLDYITAILGDWVKGHRTDTGKLVNALDILQKAMAVRPTGDMGHIAAAEQMVLQGADLSGFDLTGLTFKSASLEGAEMSDVTLDSTNLSLAMLDEANLRNAKMKFVQMAKTSFEQSILEYAHGAYVDGAGAMFPGARAEASTWVFAEFPNTDFRRANLRRARFVFANLTGADFSGADLSQALFIGSDIRGAKFDGAIFENTDMTMTVGNASQLSDAQQAQICARPINRERISLLEVDDGHYETLFEQYVYPVGTLDSMSRCSASTSGNYDPGWPLFRYPSNGETISIHYPVTLERSFLGKYGRSRKYLSTMQSRLDWLLALWKAGGFMAAPSREQSDLMDALQRNSRLSRTRNGKVYVTASENVLLLLLTKYKPAMVSEFDWTYDARAWLENREQRSNAEWINSGTYNDWEQFFPDGLTPQNIGPEQSRVYKAWTENRGNSLPKTLHLRKTFRSTSSHSLASGENEVYAPLRGYRGGGTRDIGSSHPDLKRSFRIGSMYGGQYGISGYMRFPHELKAYQIKLPKQVRDAMGGTKFIEGEFTIKGVEIEMVGELQIVFFDAEMLNLRVIGNDGSVYPDSSGLIISDTGAD